MLRWLVRLSAAAGAGIAAFLLGVALVTSTYPEPGPPLTVLPGRDFTAADAGEIGGLEGYTAMETRLLDSLRKRLVRPPAPPDRPVFDRYVQGSPSDPARFAWNWNRTRIEAPPGSRGAVLLLHGLSDSPYSLRAVGERYRRLGFAAVWLRLPGHGTAPSALRRVRWEDWAAAARLAADRVASLAGEGPFHVVGYSNGGSLALMLTLERLLGRGGRVPDQVVLLSPAVAIPAAARFTRWVRLIDWIPGLRRAAWQDIEPEVDPYKYGSFPFNASFQCWRGTRAVRRLLDRAETEGRLAMMPPVLAFVSVVDATVTAPAVQRALLDRLPGPGNELVLFDVNRRAGVLRLLSPAAQERRGWNLEPEGAAYTLTLVTNRDPSTAAVVERLRSPDGAVRIRETGLAWPPGVYSLSHVAIPFPPDDPIYGDGTAPGSDRALPLGSLSLKGETRQLQLPASLLGRLRYDPFFDVIARRIAARAAAGSPSRAISRSPVEPSSITGTPGGASP